MKQNAGLIAIMTMFLAFFGLSNLPKSIPNGGTAPETTSKTKSSQKQNASNRTLSPACEEIGARLEPFLKERPFLEKDKAPKEWEHPRFCYEDFKKAQNTYTSPLSPDVHFVIVTLPNPMTTHLPLMFDRMIEVIEQAAEDDKYSYDSSWFPWDETSKDSSSFADQLLAEQALKLQQTQPGVVVFRRAVGEETTNNPYQSGLVVFVVAEQPTGGIDREEFESALGWIEWLGGLSQKGTLRILGPSFSGSLPSLDQALDSEQLKGIPITVSSGTASSQSSYLWFKKRMERYHFGTFQTAMEGDSLMLDRLVHYLESQHYSTDCVAIVSEDETAFGSGDTDIANSTNQDENSECNDEHHPIYLYYPRDIATLRSAYEQQSILSPSKQQASASAASSTLRGDLSEPNSSDHDTVRSYGGGLTPLAQESVLLNIVNILKEKRIQFVIVRSTNSLDQLFLAQFLRRAYPSARVVIDGADLLFERGAEGSSLRGVMTLSTYPLLTWQKDWTSTLLNENKGSYRVFGEDIAEGLYIAAREMFLDRKECLNTPDPCLPIGNYAPPVWALNPGETIDDPRPPTWLSVIGQHRFWPVAVLNAAPNNPHCELLPTASCRRDKPIYENNNAHPLRITTELSVLLIACGVWSGLHCIWCWRGSIQPARTSFRLAHFAPLPRKQHSALIAFGSFLLAAVAVVTAASCGLIGWTLNGWRGAVLAVWGVLVLLISCLACWKNFTLPYVPGKSLATWRRGVVVTAMAGLVLFAWLHYWLIGLLSEENKLSVYWRCIHLLDGVSGLLPQILLVAGMYIWFWFSLRGLALFGEDRPLLPELSSLPVDPMSFKSLMPMFSRSIAAEPAEKKSIPVSTYYLGLLTLMCGATISVFWLVLEGPTLRTLAERSFGQMMFFWLSLCIAIILADTVQLWTSWRKLRPLLVYLDRLPLRRTLASLQGLCWDSIWAVSGNTLEERYRLISRQFESLRHLQNLLEQRGGKNSANEHEVLDKIRTCLRQGQCFVKWYVEPGQLFDDVKPLRDFQEELAATAGSALTNVLLPEWQRETESLLFDRARGDSKDSPDKEKDKDKVSEASPPGASDAVPSYVLAAEEFFVLPYLGFIQNILGRMRTIVLGSLFLFVATTFAVSSYPFDPLPVLGGIFLTVFLITGGAISLVFVQMHRDATLSHITNTQPGKLDGQFWLHLLTFGVGPLLGLLTTLFPAITDFVSSWLQPGVQALK